MEENAFNAPAITVEGGAAVVFAAVEREKAEVQGAIISAKKFPRDENLAYTKIIKAVSRRGMAEIASYSYPRGGQKVTGPSVVLAREAARCWGNIGSGFTIVEMTGKEVHIRGFAIDYETNARAILEDKFDRLIQRKIQEGGKKVSKWISPDERELRELVNKRGALLERNCILKLLPSDIIDSALDEASSTLRKVAKGELKENRDDTLRKLLQYSDKIGVTKADLEWWLDHDLDQITEDELADLRGIFASIKEGNSSVLDYFHRKNEGKESELNGLIKKGGENAENN